ncbi:MAG: glycosyltransferase family 2 protein [Vicinamibacterales bacterium]
MDLSVIVPTATHQAILGRAVESLLGQVFPPERFEIIVVDNGRFRLDPSVIPRECSGGPRVVFVREERPGLHHARHAGARAAAAEILGYIDDDSIVSPDWAARILACFESPRVGVAGGKTIGRFEGEVPIWLRRFGTVANCPALSLLDLGEGRILLPDGHYVYGCNMAVRHSILREVGGFNPDGMPEEAARMRGDGECGLMDKVRAKGYSVVYDGSVVVEHWLAVERLQEKYFVSRLRREGISRAYTLYRRSQGVATMAVVALIAAGRATVHSVRARKAGSDSVWHRAQAAYNASLAGQALRIVQNSELRRHITAKAYY